MPGRYRFQRPSRRIRLTRLELRERQQKLESHDLPVNRRSVAAGNIARSPACKPATNRQARALTLWHPRRIRLGSMRFRHPPVSASRGQQGRRDGLAARIPAVTGPVR